MSESQNRPEKHEISEADMSGIETGTRLMTPKQAAARLAICERKLWSLTKEGRIPVVKFDRVVRYDVNDLDGFIRSMKGTR